MFPDNIGEVIRDARMEVGISQFDLSTYMGCSVWTLNRLEHGKRRFEGEWLDRLPPAIRQRVAKMISTQLRQNYWDMRDVEKDATAALEAAAPG